MLEVSIFRLSMIFLLDFGTVPAVLYFFVFHCKFHLLPLIEPTGMFWQQLFHWIIIWTYTLIELCRMFIDFIIFCTCF